MNKKMGLNCKQGELAVVVRSYAGNEGAVVTCVELIPRWTRVAPDGWGCKTGPAWVTDRVFRNVIGGHGSIVPDDQLRPLRDGDGDDEMLRIAGRPQERERV